MKISPFISIVLLLLSLPIVVCSQENSRWDLMPEVGIQWQTRKIDSHLDHIEMSGFRMAAIVHYGVDQGKRKKQGSLGVSHATYHT